MSYTEDFIQKYQGTCVRADGKWFYISDVKARKTTAKDVKDLLIYGSFWETEGKTLELLGSEITWDFSIPENRLVNGELHSYWFTRSPERQWHRGLCKNNSKFLQVGNYMLYYITRYLIKEKAAINPSKEEESFDELSKLLFENRQYPSYSEAISELLEGKRITTAIDNKYSIGLSFPSPNFVLYRKSFEVGEVRPDELNIIHCLIPALRQEILDFTRKIPGIKVY